MEKMNNRRAYTNFDDNFIRENYNDMSPSQIGQKLNRTTSAIKNRVFILGLKLDKDVVGYERLGFFPKGIIPHNKGKRMKPETYEKCKKTMFKPKSVPHNKKAFGYIRIDTDGFHSIKLKNGFMPLNRFIWEQYHNEKLSDKFIICYIDGNRYNNRIENLKKISKVENIKNNTMQRFSPKVRELLRLNSKIKKLIKNETTK